MKGEAPPPSPRRRAPSPRRRAARAAKEEEEISDSMTVAALKKFAKDKGIAGYSKYTKKADLIKYLRSQLKKEAPAARRKPSRRRTSRARRARREEEEEEEEEEEIRCDKDLDVVKNCRSTSSPLKDIRAVATACGLEIHNPEGKLRNRKNMCDALDEHFGMEEEEEEPTVPEEEEPTVPEEEEPTVPEEEEPISDEEKAAYLMTFKIDELKDLLRRKGIFPPSGVGVTKKELINDYIMGEFCYPERGLMCSGKDKSGKEKVCDVRDVRETGGVGLPNGRGICISEKRAAGLTSFIYKGKKIVGSAAAIAALREKLEPKPTPPKPAAAPKPAAPPPEISEEDIADVLDEIKETPEAGDIQEVRQHVFRCLGLISE